MTAAGGLPSGDDGPHVFVADVDDPVVDPDDRHHLERSLRLRPGDPFTVADDTGRWRRCRLGSDVEIVGDIVAVERPTPALTVAASLVKGQRPEFVVQKLTELGIDKIVLFEAARSVVRLEDSRAQRQLERLRRVAREAAMQSRQVRLPEIEFAQFAAAAALDGAVLADRGGEAPAAGLRTVLVGPEGGWSDDELASGLPRVRLSESVLRAETAAMAAGVAMAMLRSGLIEPRPAVG